MIKIYAAKLQSLEEFKHTEKALKKYAQSHTLKKIDSYKSLINKQRSLIGEMLAYKGLEDCFQLDKEEIVFQNGEKGKPYLKDGIDKYFNITHSGEWVACAISDKEIGLDIEIVNKARLGVANRFFTNKEIEAINSCKTERDQDHYFYTLWTCKEAYLKYLGTGLTKPLNSFNVNISTDSIMVDESDFSKKLIFSKIMLDDNHIMMSCSHYSIDTFKEIDLYKI